MADMAAFRAERRHGIGASDAWDCVFNPLRVYLDKTGGLPEESRPELAMGLLLEDVVAAMYERATGHVLHKPHGHYERAGRPWMRANPDRLRATGKPVELKTSGSDEGWGEPGTDEIPERYILQVQQQMACVGADEADVAALIRLADFRIYTVRRSQEIIDRLTEIEGELWERIQRRDPPPPDWSHPDTPRLVELLHRPDEGAALEVTDPDVVHMLDSYQHWGIQIREAEKIREEARARIIERMGGASKAILPDGRTIRRKLVKVAPQQREGYEFWNFTVSNPKRSKSHE